ncbi:MAG: NFACT family protein [Clostridiales bacterium]|nr:NFACT family protein [Clostridiales bacterium]
MAFDGLVISSLAHEFREALSGGRINKIYQPEGDELILTIKNNRENYRLLISASASLPLIYLTDESRTNPLTAPNFCMLLRKHLSGGKILNIVQPDMERILRFEIEHLDDMGDTCIKYLIVELMGKHSNIIFTQPDGTIIDSIKHISQNISSVREVLPGRMYFIPKTVEKKNPLTVSKEEFFSFVLTRPEKTGKALYTSLTGLSPIAAEEICFRSGIDSDRSTDTLKPAQKEQLFEGFKAFMEDIKNCRFTPNIVYRNDEPIEFSCVPLTCYETLKVQEFSSMSKLLESYYAMKNTLTRIRQKSSDLRRIVSTALDRSRKKYQLQLKQMADTQKKDKYKVYGELINTYGYELEPMAKSLTCLNYYTNEEITIPLDPDLSARENSIRYFERYNKLKRTGEALEKLLIETKDEIDHLESIATALNIALYEEDLAQIKEELVEYGYIRRHTFAKGAKRQQKSRPFHYISSDGYDIYVGKNNFQNEELTFKLAAGNDWWFHAKGIPGSHVIVKSNSEELPDQTFEEAARLAAYYSSGRNADKVEIDYIQKKHIKKVSGAKPGFVIYHTNYSMVALPNIEGLTPGS